MPNTTTPLAELATTFPAASRIFHRHRLDYCCGGDRTLADACAAAGLDAADVLADILRASDDGARPVSERTPSELAAYIVERYHAPLREDLPRLSDMARKVERVHAEKPGCPVGLADHLDAWGTSVLEHLEKEEQLLFPHLDDPDRGIVSALQREHDDHAGALRRTRELTGELVAPANACATWRALYLGLDALERDLMEHVHLENHVLFPRALTR